MSATNLRSQYSSIDTALAIDNEAIKSIAVEVMVVGTKSVELVKSFWCCVYIIILQNYSDSVDIIC